MLSLFHQTKSFASLVKLAHTVFAAPFAFAAIAFSLRFPHQSPTSGRLALIAVCLVSARTTAMAYNRIVDRDIDAKNPRTRGREIPAGVVSLRAAWALVATASTFFVVSAAGLGVAAGLLSVPVLGVLLSYSHAKRFTWASHLWLGASLALAPGGAWIAMGAPVNWAILCLMAFVVGWVAGFDILYSLQDASFDRRHGLHSIPAIFGGVRAVWFSRAIHAASLIALGVALRGFDCGVAGFAGLALVACLLLVEHALVRIDPKAENGVSLARLNRAFFDVNGYVSVGFFALTLLDVWLRPHS
jgi:4-hydroxybenzoate polyprenyltransferase